LNPEDEYNAVEIVQRQPTFRTQPIWKSQGSWCFSLADSQSFRDRAQGAPNTAVTFRVDAVLTLSDLQKLVRRVIASQTPFGDQFVEHVLS
jgi:hypothetical protein